MVRGLLGRVLLVCGLALARARRVLVFWPDFDVSMPSCAVSGVTGLELSYDELGCGSLSHTCYPSTCIDACKADVNCENIVVKAAVRTCQFRCKEHLLEDFDMVPRLGYTTFQLTDEEVMIAMDIDIAGTYQILNSPLGPWTMSMIFLAACAFVASIVVFLCTGVCKVGEPLQSYVEEGRAPYGAMLGFSTAAKRPPPKYAAAPR